MRYFFTADEHYGYKNIIKYCARPFASVEEMDEEIIKRHNAVVTAADTVIHVGDFTLGKSADADAYIKRLNGKHVFLKGSHDKWLKNAQDIWEREIEGRGRGVPLRHASVAQVPLRLMAALRPLAREAPAGGQAA